MASVTLRMRAESSSSSSAWSCHRQNSGVGTIVSLFSTAYTGSGMGKNPSSCKGSLLLSSSKSCCSAMNICLRVRLSQISQTMILSFKASPWSSSVLDFLTLTSLKILPNSFKPSSLVKGAPNATQRTFFHSSAGSMRNHFHGTLSARTSS